MIRLSNVGKQYGTTVALRDINLMVPARGIVGLVGLNGSGKTTLLSILAGLLAPSEGKVVMPDAKHDIAYVPERCDFEPWLTCREIVTLAAKLTGRSEDDACEALASVGLVAEQNRRVGALSRGTRQRLALASAVARRADVTLLDEPLSGIDPVNRRLVLPLIRSLHKRSVVVFSSHRLDDVLSVSDLLLVLAAGHLLFAGSPQDLPGDDGRGSSFVVQVGAGHQGLADALRSKDWVLDVSVEQEGRVRFEASSHAEAESEIVPVLRDLGLPLQAFGREELHLEDVLAELLT